MSGTYYRIDDDGRECTKCRVYQSWDNFGPHPSGSHGKQSRCYGCGRKRAKDYVKTPEGLAVAHRAGARYRQTPKGKLATQRKRIAFRWGLTLEQYDRFLNLYDGNCHFCREPEIATRYGEVIALSMDHDHFCDQGHAPDRGCPYCIRGALCRSCNWFIGRVDHGPWLQYQETFKDYLARRPLLAMPPPVPAP